MFVRSRVAAVLVSGVALFGMTQAALAQADLVYLAKGGPSRGSVADMSRDQVRLDVGGIPKPFQVHEIVKITYAAEPSELNNGRTAALARNYVLALQELRKLDGATPPERDLIRQDIDFYKALSQARLALAEGGDKAGAATAMLSFAVSAQQNYHFYEAAEVLGDLSVSLGKYADAVKYYGSIAKAPWPDYQMRANYAVGKALTLDKQFDQALSRFEAVLSDQTTPDANRQKLLANIGKATCLAETGKAEPALAIVQEIISKNDAKDQLLFAHAYNALGKCYLKLTKPRDAVLAFLHTDLLYSTESDAHAEALYYLSKHWPDTEKAAVAKNTLRERYAGTVWTQQ